MKTISRLFLAASLAATLGFSGIISGVSIIINDEPITLYEVYKYSEKLKISKKESLDFLVRQKLEEAQIKKLRIDADVFEVDNFIEKIAAQNGLSQYEFLNMIKAKNIDIDDYKTEIKDNIKKEKLYASIYREKLTPIEEADIEAFYNENIKEFAVANKFEITSYISNDPQALQAILNNPMMKPETVQIENATLESSQLSNQLKSLLNATQIGNFTQISNIQNKATMFYVKDKSDITTLPLKDVKQNIYSVLSKQNEAKILKDYFEKIKASATIKVIRNPS